MERELMEGKTEEEKTQKRRGGREGERKREGKSGVQRMED